MSRQGIAPRAVETAASALSKATFIELVAKIGYAARGIVFVLILVGTALGIGVKAISANLDENLKAAAKTRRWIVAAGRIGNLSRAAVFLLVGGFLINAAVTANSRQAKGLAGALQSLESLPYGWVLLGLSAIGLVAFGIYELVLTGYRRVEVPKDRS